MVGEAAALGLAMHPLLATRAFLESAPGRRLLPRLPLPPLEIEAELLSELTDADSPRGILAVVHLPRGGAGQLPLVEGGVYVLAEGLQDPGNLGALARVAEASGAAAICCTAGSAHPNHPRALRAAAGSLLRLPAAVGATAAELAERLAPLSPTWLALVPRGGEDLYAEPPAGTLVLALGAEGAGLSAATRQLADRELTIPLAPPVESLNATVAAALALFELNVRRRQLREGAE